MNVRKQIIDRFSLIYWIFIVAGIASFLSIVYIAGFKSNYYDKIQIAIDEDDIPAERGSIYDINGRMLATSVSIYEIRWDTQTEYLTDKRFQEGLDGLCLGLSEILGEKTPEQYKKEFIKARKKENRDYFITRGIEYLTLEKIKKLPIFKKGRNRGGIKVYKTHNRKLLHNNLARRTIGFKNSQDKYFGIEEMAGGILGGSQGIAKMNKLGNGLYDIIKIIKAPKNGDNIIATIDINMQDIIDKALRKRLIELDAEFGVAILMEVKTGEIRAVANLSKTKNGYREIENLAATSLYEPGSVMKLASFMSAFEEDNSLNLNRKFNTTGGKWQITNLFSIKDYNYKPNVGGGFGIINVQQIFEKSSNTGTAKLIHSIFKDNPESFIRNYSLYYFDKKLDFNLKNKPQVSFSKLGKEGWSGISIRQMSIGYEIMLTPYHIITFYNAVANNGKMMKPMFVKQIKQNDEIIETKKSIVLNSSICSKRTLNYCQQMLKGAVNNGTGKKHVKSDLVSIAGKTGTAQILINDKYVSDTTQYNVTFVGYFPAETPKYTCFVWISEPQRHKSGGSGAGPVVKEIAEKIHTFDYDLHQKEFVVNNMQNTKTLPYAAAGFTGMLIKSFVDIGFNYKNSNSKWAKPISKNNQYQFKPISVKKGFVPDVRNMNVRDAIFLLENIGMSVSITGSGKVIKQSIAPNTKIKKGQKIKLTLKS
ncbi:MAG: penicillin-binding protein [Bacteroidota bacterium]|nr:penicillin-binding protein [Bacteroidota bacterium]